jgi:hypothetical protein
MVGGLQAPHARQAGDTVVISDANETQVAGVTGSGENLTLDSATFTRDRVMRRPLMRLHGGV